MLDIYSIGKRERGLRFLSAVAYTKWPSAVKASRRRRSTTTMTRSLEDEFPPPSLNSHAFGGRRARDVSCDKDPKSARR